MLAAEKIKRLNRLYAVASGINEAMVRIPQEKQLYLEACRIAVERGGFMMAWVGRNDPVHQKLEPVATWGNLDGYVESISISTDPRVREGIGPGATAFRSGEPSVCNDIEADPPSFEFRREALARGYRSCAAFPIKLEDQPVAVFFVYAAVPLHFDSTELALLTSLAENFSFAIEARERDRQRRSMETALRISEARLRAVVDNQPECVRIVSPAGNLLDMNPAGLAMFQAESLALVLGSNAIDLVHEDDREAARQLHVRVCAGATERMQMRAQGLRGRTLWIDTHAAPLLAADGSVSSALYLTRDVTAERAASKRLEHNQALLRIASRLGRIGAWEVDLSTLAVTWSDELSLIHEMPGGYCPSTLEAALRFYGPGYRQVMRDAFDVCARDGVPFDLELEVVTASGRQLCVRSIGEAVRDASGAFGRVQGATQDITDRKAAEDDIRHLAEQLTTTLESITDALVTVDAQWRFTYVNHEAERVLHRTRAELLGTNMWAQFPEGRGTAFERAYEKALAESRMVEIQEFYPPLDTWIELRAYPSARGGLTIYFRDSSERQAAREEVLRLNAELEQRVRQRTAQLEMANRELQAFSYSVAHDLRAPLAAISGFSQALDKELDKEAAPVTGERARHYLARMREGVLRTSDMIDALLSLAQLSRAELRWEEVDLAAAAERAVEHCREQSPGREVQVRIQPDMMVQGDPRLLQLVMDNLVGNAWKFTAEQPAPKIEVGWLTGPEGETIYEVRDNGIGFDMSYAGNLFSAFQRLHPQAQFPGTGIGLANVRRIISRHSGRIWAHAQPGQGTAFYFTLGDEPA